MIAPRTVLPPVSGAQRRFPVIIDDEQPNRSSERAWQAFHGVPVPMRVSFDASVVESVRLILLFCVQKSSVQRPNLQAPGFMNGANSCGLVRW